LSSSSTSNVAGSLDGPAARRPDVAAHQTVYAAMPMALKSPPMVVGINSS